MKGGSRSESHTSRAAVGDALLYLASAAFALCLLRFSPFVKYRAWAGFAAPTYVTGALAAVAVAVLARRSRRALARARLLIALALLIGTLAVPLAAEVWWRAERGASYAMVIGGVAVWILWMAEFGERAESYELQGNWGARG